ncbi:SRPBCC family protein [Ornithinibacillus scapharcae]|uniref:SRPBCC family protein n=1 Tax=Ornithinibacillus scapharcae TaxID=1147159 RepID=UPI000225BB68|nr:SRPBCC family protein [Ornithinibacillus scapharcae]
MEEKLLFRLEEFIDAPIEVVFDYVDDDEKIKLWNDYMIENIYENETKKNTPGSKFISVQQFGRKKISVEVELLEFEPPNKIIMVSDSKEGTSYTRYFLTREYDGTRLVMESSIIPKNTYYRILTKLFGGLGKYVYEEQIQALKDYVELRDFED